MTGNDFAYCEAIIKQHSGSFYKAFKQLGGRKAEAVYAIYAFCRTADDIVDESGDALALGEFYTELRRFDAGSTPDKPLWRALRRVFDTYAMDVRPFYEMLEGQKKDISFTSPVTEDELMRYCYLVAGTVGLMLLPVLSGHPTEALRHASVELGQAMQLTNILRDIGEDMRMGRCYLPTETMKRFGLTEEDLRQEEVNQPFIALWEYLAGKAEALYSRSLQYIDGYDQDSRLPILLAAEYYGKILDKARKQHYDVFEKRPRLSRLEKLMIYGRVRLGMLGRRPKQKEEVRNHA